MSAAYGRECPLTLWTDTASVVELIATTLTRYGDGKDDPVRIVTQLWTHDGKLVAEWDPCCSLRVEAKWRTIVEGQP